MDNQNQDAAKALSVSGDDDNTALIYKRIGRASVYRMQIKLLTVMDILELKKIKESKQYKGFVHIDENGNREFISTWEEYCPRVEGRSRHSIDNEILNLEALGTGLFEALRDVGAGPGIMRDIRRLPEDDKLLLEQATQAGSKEEIVELLDGLVTKYHKEKEGLEAQIRDKAADAQKADERANRLNLEVEKKQDTIDTLRKAQNLNPEFSLDTNIIRQQAALLDQQCAVSLAALHEMAVTVTDEDQDSPEWPVRLQSIWFAAHAAYARSLQLVLALRDLDVHGLAIPADPDQFKAGIFTADEAQWFADEVDINRAALANALTKKRVDMKEAAPRGPGRPAKKTK